jgi:hypothetical protein
VPDLIEYYRRNPDKFVDKENRFVELIEPIIMEDDLAPVLDRERFVGLFDCPLGFLDQERRRIFLELLEF